MIPCQCCYNQYPIKWNWLTCNNCGYRICIGCVSKHKGRYSNGGFKCSKCMTGQLKNS